MSLLGNLVSKAENLAGRVYNDVRQPIAPGVQQQIAHAIANAPIIHPLLQNDQNMVNAAANVARAPINVVKLATANMTHNAPAAMVPRQQLVAAQHATGGIVQGIPHGLLEGGLSARELLPGSNQNVSIRPTNPLTRAIIGKQPVTSIQHQYTQNRQNGVSIPNALTNAGISIAGDLPIALGAGKLAADGAAVAGKAGLESAARAGDMLQGNARPTKLNDNQMAAVNSYRQKMGTPELDNQTYHSAVQALNKAGINHTDTNAIDNLIGQFQTYKNRQVAAQAGFVKIPGVKDTPEVIPPAPKAPLPDETAPNQKLSRFANVTIQKSPEVSPQVKQLVKDENVTYAPTTNKGRVATAENTMANMSHDEAYTHAVKILEDPARDNGQAMVTAGKIAQRLDETGNEANHYKATEIYRAMSERGSKTGQETQALSIIARRSPEGIKYDAIKQLKKAGVSVTDDAKGKLKSLSKDDQSKFNQLTDAVSKTKEGTQERMDAVGDLHNFVSDRVPASMRDKLFTLWRTGLLTGPQTITKVGASHLLQNVLENAKQIPATAIDKAISPITHQRSTALTQRGVVSGAKVGLKAGGHLLRTGKDTMGTGGFSDTAAGMLAHPDVSYGTGKLGQATNFYTQKVGQVHAAIPKPYFTSAQANDLFKQAIAAAKTQKLKGSDYENFVNNFVKNASDEAQAEAQHAGQMATFQQHTTLGRMAKKYQTAPGGRVLAPFAHIASAILTDASDYSPIGAGKAIYQAVKDKGETGWTPTVQKHFVEELGRSITGTAAVAMGYELYKHGLLTLNYPTSPKEQALWKAQGKQENAIKIGNQWRSTASLGPIGTVLAAGGFVGQSGENTIKKGKVVGQVGDALEGALENLTSQSFLSGSTGFAQAIANPGQNLKTYAKQQAGSVIPIAVQTTARATDPYQRQTTGIAQAVQSKIPGLREGLPTQTGTFGNPMQRNGGVFTNLLDPTRPITATNDTVTNELQRLMTTTGSAGNATPVAPKTISGKDAQGNTQTFTPTPQQKNQVMQTAGPATHSVMSQIISDPRYKNLSEDDKNTILNYVTTDYSNIARANVASNVQGGLTTKLNTDQKNILQGKPVDYFSKLNSSNASSTGQKASLSSALSTNTKSAALLNPKTPPTTDFYKPDASQYQTQLAKYNAGGFKTPAAQIKAQQSLAKAKIGANYSSNIRSLYGLSASQLYNYASTNPDGNKIVQQVLAYGDDLTNAGLASKNKFRTSTGAANIKSASSTKAAKTAKSVTAANKKVGTLNSSIISKAGSLNKKVASAKFTTKSLNSKVSKPKMVAYKKSPLVKIKKGVA